MVAGLLVLIATAAAHTLQPNRGLHDFATFVQSGRAYDQGLNPYAPDQDHDPAAGTEPGTPLETDSLNLNRRSRSTRSACWQTSTPSRFVTG